VSRISIRHVARHVQLSLTTVSRVISGIHSISLNRRQQVLDVLDTLDYRPNKFTQALNSQTIPLLALIVLDISNPELIRSQTTLELLIGVYHW
jgi:LacI family transcriptional regulator